MKRILCYLKAIPQLVRSGIWCPHTYKEIEKHPSIIITTKNGFRVAKNYMHRENETVYPNATLVKSKCKYCGAIELSWFNGKEENIPVI